MTIILFRDSMREYVPDGNAPTPNVCSEIGIRSESHDKGPLWTLLLLIL